jgi:hypothetical protein
LPAVFQIMTFFHGWAIWVGAAALAAPLVIHWLTRPRPTRMPLSTLRFVHEAIRHRRARHWLRDLLVLGLRMLAVALLAMAVARPLLGPQPLVSDRLAGDAVRVVLVDVSQSMAATVGAIQEIDQARALAADRYLRYRPGLWANLILAGATPRSVFDGPSTNFEALRDELSRCQALPERLDVKAALERAAQMLAPASADDQRRRELVILSDFQRSSWAMADFSVLPRDTQIQLESTAPAQQPENLAILRASARVEASRPGGVQVEVEVGNFTPAARKVTVEVVLGQVERRLEGPCPAKGRVVLTDEIEFHDTGWQWGEARLVGVDDALAADNVRPLVVQLRPRPTYILLTREPAGRRPSSSYFLECALVPDGRDKERASATLVRLDPSALDAKALAQADLVCLDHPGKLPDDAVKTLAGLLRRGQPLLYVAAEPIDATNLKRLGEAAGPGLQMPVEFTPPPAGQVRRNLFLKSVRGAEPPFQVFGDDLATVTGRLRFGGGLSSRQLQDAMPDEVLATYNDGSACLVSTSSDAGTLAVLNADLAASNLPNTSAFVLLVAELTERLVHRGSGAQAAFCGQRLVAPLPPGVASTAGLSILAPGAASAEASGGRLGELVEEGAGAAWHWPSPDRPGVYRIVRDGVTLLARAVEIPPEESDLESLDLKVIKDRLATGYQVYYRQAESEEDRRDDFWKWLAAACAFCMLGEVVSLLVLRT